MRLFRALVCLLALLVAAPAWGAVTFDATTTQSNAAGNSFSFNHPVGAGVTNGAIAILITFASAAANTVGVTIGGVSATPSVANTDISATVRSAIYCRATGNTTGNIAIFVNLQNSDTIAIASMSASGVDQTTPCQNGASNSFSGAGTTCNGAATATRSLTINSSATDLSFDVITDNSASGTAFGIANQTSKWQFVSNFTTDNFGSVATTPASSVAHSWCQETATNAGTHSGADFLAASGGVVTPTRTLMGVGP